MENKIYAKVYSWMFIGLLVSFLTGYGLTYYPNIIYNVMGTNLFYVLIIIELAVAIFFGARITKMSKNLAIGCYLLYSFLTGFTLSIIFLAYEISSILLIFGITAGLFGIFAVYGYLTNKDLTKLGTFLVMGLLGIIIATVINIFVNNSTFDLVISVIGIILFLLFVAYDMKKIKSLINYLGEEKGAIYGAFELYLDFINLFLRLISIFGKSRD